MSYHLGVEENLLSPPEEWEETERGSPFKSI
jgi:hypothetical protein